MAMTDPFQPRDPSDPLTDGGPGQAVPADDGLAGGGEAVPGEQAPGDDAAHGPVSDDEVPAAPPEPGPARLA